MKWKALLMAATLLAPLPALAVSEPVPGTKDSRVRTVAYDAREVVRLTSTGQTPLQIILEAGEKPTTIAGPQVVTDAKVAKEWLATAAGSVLILQPLRELEPSTLFVRTVTADGRERYYSFELRTRTGTIADPSDRAAYMTVEMTYKAVPPPPSPEQVAAAEARREAAQAAAAERATKVRFEQAQFSGARNYQYSKRDPEGCPLLAPVYVFDDGNRTTLVFAPHTVLPEIYVINQDGKEAIVTTVNEVTATGLEVVLPSVQREMRLRRGGKVCALRDNALDPYGTQPGGGTGTISPDVVRQVRQ